MNYPLTLGISYKNDIEYQQQFCHLVNMTLSIKDSLDEWNDKYTTQFLDLLYSETHTINVFRDLYSIAASKIISMNCEIGFAILMSFTYFETFHQCLVFFFQQDKKDEILFQNHPSFILLKSMLNTK